MKYGMDKNNHQDWLNKGPWYNTHICLKLHGSMFEDFITHARTDSYNLTCSSVAHNKMKPNDEDDEISLGRCLPMYPFIRLLSLKCGFTSSRRA